MTFALKVLVGVAISFGVYGLSLLYLRLRASPLVLEAELPLPSRSQRMRFHLGRLLGVALGIAGAALFYALSPFQIDGAQLQFAFMSKGDMLSATLLAVSLMLLVVPIVVLALVEPTTYRYFHDEESRRAFGANILRLYHRLGSALFLLAIAVHLCVRNSFVAADQDRLWWSDFLEIQHREATWNNVRELRVVEVRTTRTGEEQEKPYLVWILEDNTRIEVLRGNAFELTPEELALAESFTRARGRPVRRMRKED